MYCIAVIVYFVTLIPTICFADLSIETARLNESLVDASIEILESCYMDRFSTVGIAGPSAGSIIDKISSRKTVIPSILIDHTSRTVPQDWVDCASKKELQVFVVTVTNQNTLNKSLAQVKYTESWNHMASFLLIDSTGIENGCSKAHEILWEAWKMDLLNSKFMCLNETRGILIYTFNPYTSKAPSPWQQENTYKGMNGHVWTLFAQEYSKDEPRCDKLDFDKTVDLGGYEIRAAVGGMETWWDEDPTKELRPDARLQNVTAQLLMDSLNATWRLSLYTQHTLTPEEYQGDSIIEIFHGTSSIALNFSPIHMWFSCLYTYPFVQIELAVITEYRGHRSQLDKLMSVLDKSSRLCVLIVLTITLFFFKFWLRKPLILAFLDLVLIICNAGLRRIPQQTAPRIYLASLFIFVVTIQGIYSGQLASLLTKDVCLSTVDSFEDLARSGHKIHFSSRLLPLFNHSAFEGRLVERGNNNFLDLRSIGATSACVASKITLITRALKYNMHLSREPMGYEYAAYVVREDWPLKERVNTIFGRLAASGIQKLLYAREIQRYMNILESYERQGQEPEPKPLTLKHLGFAFKILAIGLACATMVFIVEVATQGWD